ncbi:hypothetical protein ACAD37_02068 [Clavibacter nebraskensis]
MWKTCSTTMAMSVVATMPMRSAPGTRRAMSTPMITRPRMKTTVGSEAMEPSIPRASGEAGTPVPRTKPESTKPMNAMKRPMPTVMAVLSSRGTARKIRVRSPVVASSTITRPLMTTRPIASGHVTSPTTLTARNELMPRPAANANGRRATRPNRIVMTPAVRAVAAPTCEARSQFPSTSSVAWSALKPPRISGLSTTMYAIVTKVRTPPRISRAYVDPRFVTSKNRSSAPRPPRVSGAGDDVRAAVMGFFREGSGRTTGGEEPTTLSGRDRA